MKHARFFIGLTAIILLYAGCTVEADEEPPRPIVLEISNLPTKVSYEKGEKLNLNGLEVKLYKTDGSFEVLKEGKYTAVPAEGTVLAEPGEKTVTITAEGLSKTFTITVVATKRLEISKRPTKMGYEKGEPLDLSGLEVTLKKSDGTSEVLEKGKYTAEPKEGTELTAPGEKTVTITAEGLTETFTICVAGLTFSTDNVKKNYTFYAPLDLSGLEVKLYHADGTLEEKYTASPEEGMYLENIGEQKVAVTVGGESREFSVSVSDEYVVVDDESNVFVGSEGEHILKSVPDAVKAKAVKVTVPESIESIYYTVFDGCKDTLSEIKLLGRVYTWRDAFKGFSGVVRVSKGDSKFRESGLKNVVIEDGVTIIGEDAFYDCSSLENVVIPNSVETIGKRAFYNCGILTSVNIPKSVTTIGDDAFSGCSSLTSVAIPDSVTTIGDGAFNGCENLKSISVGEKNTAYFSDGTILYGKDKTKLIAYPSASGDVAIPDSVTTIGNSAFSGCDNLTSVTIPAGVTTIGDSAFSGCCNLTSVAISDSVTTIGDYAFCNCDNLTSVEIPGSVMTIGGDAFSYSEKLTSVIIKDGVPIIGYHAFTRCGALTSVSIPKSVTTIGEGAFGAPSDTCPKLESVTYNGSKEDWNEIVVWDADDNSVGTMSDEECAFRVGLKDKKIVCTGGEIIQY